jgi:FMN-dependent oxidoreductase (nitrilotriacetate monooxygenase family)
MTKKQLRLAIGAYPDGWNPLAWRLPEAYNRALQEVPYHYANLGRLAERGKFDYIFIGSGFSVSRRLRDGHSPKLQLRVDLTIAAGYLASVTRGVGIVVSANSSLEHPYIVARQIATLDHFSQGRAGLNIVFGGGNPINDGENFGLADPVDPAFKYERAEEFITVVKALLGSWDRDYLVDDRAGGERFRYDAVHDINFNGKHLQVQGALNVPPPIQEEIPVVGVGLSEFSEAWAVQHSHLRFTPYVSLDASKANRTKIRNSIAAAGRDPDKYPVLPRAVFYTAGTAREAHAKFREISEFVETDQVIPALSERLGIDLRGVKKSKPIKGIVDIEAVDSDIAISINEATAAFGGEISLEDFLRFSSNRQQVAVVGDAKTIADWFEENLEAGALDGVQFFPPYHNGPAEAFVDLVIPELQRRGIFRREYQHARLGQNLGIH